EEFIKMKKSYSNFYFYVLLTVVLISGAGCNLANIKAEKQNPDGNQAKAEAKFNDDEAVSKPDSAGDVKTQITAESVAGNYDYDTHHDGEGYDNSLEIKAAGGNKLYVYLSGSYIYKVGETQSFHEAEGKGDALLRGNTANATLVDEAGKPCRATITFKKDEAAVKIPDTCQFNIALDGVYKRVQAKTKAIVKKDSPKMQEVSYAEVMDFVNDFDKHKTGERYVITDVPANKTEKKMRADEFGNQSYKNLFYLEENDDDGYTGSSLLTSKAMVESLAREAEYEPAALRVYAVLVESNGKFDVYRMSFVTKIEGLNDDGSVLWTAEGGDPIRTKFRH
ncbi:MAG TPA: hypothetical protein VK308_13540, partial [Pyrinomonadaceae bacterium]|nr:hypothetical protein [Pyrinomonadaceae bacterium]